MIEEKISQPRTSINAKIEKIEHMRAAELNKKLHSLVSNKKAKLDNINTDADEDEGGSGGSGKKKGHSFKGEKLLKELTNGRLKGKSKAFSNFLGKQGISWSSLSDSSLSHSEEGLHAGSEAEEASQTNESKQDKNKNKSSKATTSSFLGVNNRGADSQVKTSMSATDAAQYENSFLGKTSGQSQTTKTINGINQIIKGGPNGAAHGNPMGFARQSGQIQGTPGSSILEQVNPAQGVKK